MDVARAIFRLLIAAAVSWLAFWGWRWWGGGECEGRRGGSSGEAGWFRGERGNVDRIKFAADLFQ